jgi:hypothetical protein
MSAFIPGKLSIGAGLLPASAAPAARTFVVGATATQYIQFAGSLVSGARSVAHAFSVLAGDGSPTVTGGGAKVAIVDRPQRVGLTVVSGYDPLTLDIPIMFDAMAATSPRTPQDIESDIRKLEWMTGRGLLYNGEIGSPGQGDPPLVRVFTANARGDRTPLVPVQYQTDNLYWLVSNVQWDANPDRAPSGYRLRQKATVTLTELVSNPFSTSSSSPAARAAAKKATAGKYRTFVTTNAVDTIKLVALKFAHNTSHSAALAIVAANKANKHVGTSLSKKLRPGTHVKVPESVVKQL